MAKSESVRIKSLPKSKMQTIREFTGLRAFVEIDESGQAIAYYIQDPDAKTFETPVRRKTATGIKRPRQNRTVLKSEQLVLGRNQVSDPYSPATTAARAHKIVIQLLPASRGALEEVIASELKLTAQQACSQLSYMLNTGHTLASAE